MPKTLVTCIQLFSIGFSFGIFGPCFFSCAPTLLTYLVAKQSKWRQSLYDITVFSSGRLLSYLILGFFAGASGVLIKELLGSEWLILINSFSGIIIIALGVSLLLKIDSASVFCKLVQGNIYGIGSLFILGMMVGISPCVPLIAILMEVGLISDSGWQGFGYMFFFGLGTFLSTLLVVGSLTGALGWIPPKLWKSQRARFIFRIICASILFYFGLNVLLRNKIL